MRTTEEKRSMVRRAASMLADGWSLNQVTRRLKADKGTLRGYAKEFGVILPVKKTGQSLR